VAGAGHYRSFLSDFGRQAIEMGALDLLIRGFWYSGTLLLILGAHEMGHYSYCRRYNIDATLPYFLPFLFFTGTLGAVIRIREAFPTRTVLFDIGVAGPIAGFMVVVPALFVGLSLSTVTLDPPGSDALLSLGEPLLFQWGAQLVFGRLPEGHTINMHPMVFASWFGMLATALNLLPFGQLDGGHITYAVFGERARWISAAAALTAGGLIFLSIAWIFPALMMAVMWRLVGLRHPPTMNPYEPLSPGRKTFALVALIAFIVCFTPTLLRIEDLVRRP
jgi:membrane-associated protease RseP (regulator of RpoE activity)